MEVIYQVVYDCNNIRNNIDITIVDKEVIASKEATTAFIHDAIRICKKQDNLLNEPHTIVSIKRLEKSRDLN